MQKLFQICLVAFMICLLAAGCGTIHPSLNKTPTAIFSPPPTKTVTVQGYISPVPSTPTTEPKVTEIPVTPEDDPRTLIAFTGVIVPARCVQEEISKQGNADYIYDEVREILSSADITVGVYNATMRDNIPYMGCVRSWELIGSTNNADALANAGFDVMSVATNHIKDCGHLYCGDEGFFSTLENLQRVDIEPVGAGGDLEDALQPVILEVNGIRFGFVSLGEVNESVFADRDRPGIAFLSNKNLEVAISSVSELADVVIVLPHSGPEDYPDVTAQQKYWALHSVEYGADLVVMTHAHILQGYQFLNEVPVFYSLGNFVFDQSWARDHQQGAILLVKFEGTKLIGFEFIPTVVDQDGTVYLPDPSEKDEILNRIEALSNDLAQGD